eukprot:TRINITY_DN2871_c0_g1_i1.p1 TRINITY_DN2871_c0_g1~~TRINITY_DN2871_c0_g1_i1.p1  ORF type:complete len:362 (+),score=41.26 TRINITY_DN2871_c0_g1_i1:46-1131(+)
MNTASYAFGALTGGMDAVYSMVSAGMGMAAAAFSESDIWVLGKRVTPQRLIDEAQRLPLFTYRFNFECIEHSSYTTDSGWGCMLRTGQMMLCQAFFRHYFRDEDPRLHEERMKEIITRFLDYCSPKCPYSIQNITKFGLVLDKQPGQWFGPSTICQVLKMLVSITNDSNVFELMVCMDGQLDVALLLQQCKIPVRTNTVSGSAFKAAIVLVIARLGQDATLNPIYIPGLLSFFRFPQFLGILGGKPNNSYYFFGSQGNDVYYLDPHCPQETVNLSEDDHLMTFRTQVPTEKMRMPMERMDPSMAIAFYIRDEKDLDDLCRQVHQHASGGHPIFTIMHGPKPPVRVHSHDPLADEDDIIAFE